MKLKFSEPFTEKGTISVFPAVGQKTKNCKLQVLWPDYWYFLPHPDDLPTARGTSGNLRDFRVEKWKEL